MVFRQKFDADLFLNFLKRLIRQNRRKVYLVIDKHPVHHSSEVSKWLKERRMVDMPLVDVNVFHAPTNNT